MKKRDYIVYKLSFIPYVLFIIYWLQDVNSNIYHCNLISFSDNLNCWINGVINQGIDSFYNVVLHISMLFPGAQFIFWIFILFQISYFLSPNKYKKPKKSTDKLLDKDKTELNVPIKNKSKKDLILIISFIPYIYIVIRLISVYFNGVDDGFFMSHNMIYGFDAVTRDLFYIILIYVFCIPILPIVIIYQIMYMKNKKSNR